MDGGGRPARWAYVRAVAEALEQTGIPVADWRADGGTIPDGWIPFDLARQVRQHGRIIWDHDAAGAGWSEEHGWFVLTVDDPGGRDVRTVARLNVGLLAPPPVVAQAVARHAGLLSGHTGLPADHAFRPGRPRLSPG